MPAMWAGRPRVERRTSTRGAGAAMTSNGGRSTAAGIFRVTASAKATASPPKRFARRRKLQDSYMGTRRTGHPWGPAFRPVLLILRQILNGFEDVRRLREDDLLEVGVVGDRCVERGDPAHGSVQVLEELVADARGQLGAESARELILVRHDHAVGLPDRRRDGVPVKRHDGAEVED